MMTINNHGALSTIMNLFNLSLQIGMNYYMKDSTSTFLIWKYERLVKKKSITTWLPYFLCVGKKTKILISSNIDASAHKLILSQIEQKHNRLIKSWQRNPFSIIFPIFSISQFRLQTIFSDFSINQLARKLITAIFPPSPEGKKLGGEVLRSCTNYISVNTQIEKCTNTNTHKRRKANTRNAFWIWKLITFPRCLREQP